MDCDVDIARFTASPFVVERPAVGDFADTVTDMLAAAGLRVEFPDANVVAREHDRLVSTGLPDGFGFIGRDGGISGHHGSEVFVSGPTRASAYAGSQQPALSMAIDGWTMAGHALSGPDRADALAFGSLMALRAGASRETLLEAASGKADPSASAAYNAAAKMPGYVDACRAKLESSPGFATAGAISLARAAIVISEGGIRNETLSFSTAEEKLIAGVRGRIEKSLGIERPSVGEAWRLRADLGDRRSDPGASVEAEREYPFDAKPYGTKHFGPSYLPHQKFNQESIRVVQGLHPDLLKVVARASEISDQDFQVVPGNGGMRSKSMQRKLKEKGASRAVLGRHTFGYAIDLVPVDAKGRVDFENLAGFDEIMRSMKQASEELGVPIDWGGSWKRLVDKPHFELNRKVYPGPNEKPKPEEVLVAFR